MHLSSMPGLQKSDADLVEEFKLIFEVCNFQFVFKINFDVSMSVKCDQVFPDIVVPHMQMYDTDCSGTIEEEELIEGLGEAGKIFHLKQKIALLIRGLFPTSPYRMAKG